MIKLPVCLGLAVTTVCSAQRGQPLELRKETVRGGDRKKIEIELGELRVPENRGKKDSREITLAFARARSTLEQPGPPVFVLAGGPGGSSIRMFRGMLRGGGRWFLDMLRGDLVAIDQRGVGQSRPNLETKRRFGLPPSEPGDPVKLLAAMREACRADAASWRAKGVDLAGYTTAESADDIDAVRRALGYDKIVLWGGSYGSHLAMATIRRHEGHIARAILIGPEGPDHTFKLPSYAQTGLTRIAKLVAADPTLAEAIPDFLSLVRLVLTRLEKEPVWVEVDGERVGVSKFDVQRVLANAIGIVRKSLVHVPARVHAMANGDFEEIARDLLRWRREADIGSAMQMVMDCASGASPERRAKIAAEAQVCLLGDAVNFPFADLAEAWAAPDLGPSFRGPLRTDVPVLFLAGDLDSRTPIRNARELMKLMPNAHLIVIENAGHDINPLQRELREAWHAFLGGESLELTRVRAPKVRFTPLR